MRPLARTVYTLGHSFAGGWRARLRALMHPFWETEICGQCGCRVGKRTDSWWRASDELWMEVIGSR